MTVPNLPPRPYLPSPFLTCCAILPTSLDGMDPIWGEGWSYSPFIKRSPSWGIPGFSSAVRQIPGDLCTALGIIPLSPLPLATDVTDVTRGKWSLTRNPDRSWWHRHAGLKPFWSQSMAQRTTECPKFHIGQTGRSFKTRYIHTTTYEIKLFIYSTLIIRIP
jgi:hypothetical protein